MAARRSLLAAAVAAFCALQVSEAASLTGQTIEAIRSSLEQLQHQAEAAVEQQEGKLTNQINAVAARIEANFTAVADKTRAQVNALVGRAEREGLAVTNCGLNATLRLAQLAVDLPIALTHCFTDNKDAFTYYQNKIDADFANGFRAIGGAVYASSQCGLLDVKCRWKINTNLTKFEADIALDVSFELFDMGTAGVNLVATVSLCNEETLAQALLDQAKVVPDTVACIEKKRQEKNQQGGSSS